MIRKHIFFIFVCTSFLNISAIIDDYKEHNILIEKLTHKEKEKRAPRKQKKQSKKTIAINYQNEDLVDIINGLAAQKNVNVILPLTPPISTKITFSLDEKVSLDEAWDMLYTLLDLAGYSLIEESTMYQIVKTDKEISREPLPLYIGTKWELLPNTDMRIRYVYYFSYIHASDDANFEIKTMLSKILPETAVTVVNTASNSITIIDKARNVRSAMEIVSALDQIGFDEKMLYLPLHFYPATTIANLFMKDIIPTAADTNKYRLDTRAESDIAYFSRYLKIIPDTRNNALIILGKEQAIMRVRDFIYKYIDVDTKSGQSILHIYQLQYLNATTFASELEKIVNAEKTGGTGQSGQAGGPSADVARFFGEGGKVIIKADTPTDSAIAQFSGGNNLVIACTNDDWVQIRKLIEQLDTPRPQVIVKVLIAELTMEEIRSLGSIIRNPAALPFPNNVSAQSAQAAGVVLQTTPTSPSTLLPTLDSDLLTQSSNPNPPPSLLSAVSGFLPGSTAVAFNDRDGRTWGILQILERIQSRRILSSPHVIADSNYTATFNLTDYRLLPDAATDLIGSGATQVNNKMVDAPIILKITPRISSANTVNLTVNVNITRFQNPGVATTSTAPSQGQGSQSRDTREVITNATVYNGDILTIGGLSRTDAARSVRGTPLISRIPILGYFFKNRTADEAETNLTVFISPIIIQPRLRGGISEYTKEYIGITQHYAREGMLFDSLPDPITRWFFTPEGDQAMEAIDEFVRGDEMKMADPLTKFENASTSNYTSTPTTSRYTTPRMPLSKNEDPRAQQIKELLKDTENPLNAQTT